MSESDAPWNPEEPTDVTPEEYEEQALKWLANSASDYDEFRIAHREIVTGSGGDFEIDVVVEFQILSGANLRVLVECKRHTDAVKRDHVLAFAMKIQDTGSHKGIVFSTAGFQKGALKFAASRGIATVTFVEGNTTYETKWMEPVGDPPPWADIPQFVGKFVELDDAKIRMQVLEEGRLNPLRKWLDQE